MARAIDADADVLISKKQLLVDLKANYQYMAVEIVNVQKPIDPVKHGKWIKDKDRDMLRCSVCKNFCVENWYYWLRYCPDCGARMDGE